MEKIRRVQSIASRLALGSLLTTLMAASSIGCGGSAPPTSTRISPSGEATEFDAKSLLRDYAIAHVAALAELDGDQEAIEAARESERGMSRRRLNRDLAAVHIGLANQAEGRDARRHRRNAERALQRAGRGNRDRGLRAELSLLNVWIAYSGGRSRAPQAAQRFVERFSNQGDMSVLASMIVGELAREAEDWAAASTAYRFVLGQLDHPLYAFALFRTAQVWTAQGRAEEGAQAMGEVEAMGCTAGAEESVLSVARQVAQLSGNGLIVDAQGVQRPERCAVTEEENENATGTDGEELPPAMQ